MHSQKILLVCSDPGSANCISSLVRYLEPYKYILISSKIQFLPESLRDKAVLTKTVGEVEKLFNENKFSYVITGTSVEDRLELMCIKMAIAKNIKSMSFVDHWTAIGARFLMHGQVVLPDKVVVNDELAYKVACKEIGPERLLVLGNPYWETIKSYKPSKSRAQIISELQLDETKKIVVFLSDNLCETFGSEREVVKELGFNEIQVFELVKEWTSLMGSYNLVLKLHPKESAAKFQRYDQIKMLDNYPLWDLFFVADFVVGMHSAAVLEAEIMAKKIIRVEPDARYNCLPTKCPRITMVEKGEQQFREFFTQPLEVLKCHHHFDVDSFQKEIS